MRRYHFLVEGQRMIRPPRRSSGQLHPRRRCRLPNRQSSPSSGNPRSNFWCESSRWKILTKNRHRSRPNRVSNIAHRILGRGPGGFPWRYWPEGCIRFRTPPPTRPRRSCPSLLPCYFCRGATIDKPSLPKGWSLSRDIGIGCFDRFARWMGARCRVTWELFPPPENCYLFVPDCQAPPDSLARTDQTSPEAKSNYPPATHYDAPARHAAVAADRSARRNPRVPSTS
mmetsp:Transcript_36490/g.87977  ORF Transcript_36490/g.87977 Transcript_36490/m.87977 type:complete len:227 (+) Transcript_36490:375-1055(+)